MLQIRPATTTVDIPQIADPNIRMALETENLRLDPPTVLAGVAAGVADLSLWIIDCWYYSTSSS